MANRLKMVKLDAILTLHQRHWSIRRIAKELGVHRDTVARRIQQIEAGAKPARAPIGVLDDSGDQPSAESLTKEGAQEGKLGHPSGGRSRLKLGQAPIGSEDVPAPERARAVTATTPKQPSLCEPWRQVILDKLAAGLTAQRIWQDLVSDHGFAGRYHSVRRFVRRLGHQQALPFRRMECAPGEEAQVDFGSGIPITQPDGKRRRTHVFRIVLSHSRKGYSEVVHRQTTEEFLRCLENAFAHFGGVPRVLVLDNLKAGVLQPDWFDPELNPKLRSFAEHYGLAVLPTRPWTPRHKGKIESGVGYVKKNALKGHDFTSLEDENRHLLVWETTVADRRIHGTIRRQVAQVFEQVERAALQPLPAARFAFFHEAQRTVHRDGHVEVARAYYSVPPEYLSRRVWVRWDGRLVRIFNDQLEAIAVHVQHEAGRFSTKRAHLADAKISAVEDGATGMLRRTRRLGTQAARWAEAMIQVRGIEGVRVLQGLLSLAKRYSATAIDQACGIAVNHAAYRLRTVRQLVKRQQAQEHARQAQFAFMDEHPLIRPLADYGRLVQRALAQEVHS
jgi:transposase